jgi:hypothetical protein
LPRIEKVWFLFCRVEQGSLRFLEFNLFRSEEGVICLFEAVPPFLLVDLRDLETLAQPTHPLPMVLKSAAQRAIYKPFQLSDLVVNREDEVLSVERIYIVYITYLKIFAPKLDFD